MVIVEPRQHPHLRYVLENFDKLMPLHYDVYIFHGHSARSFAQQAATHLEKRRLVHYLSLNKDSITADEYNMLLKMPHFWNAIEAENILIFQTDSVLCSQSPFSIEDFENFGYIGCAFDSHAGRGTHWHPHAFWGVGGLSFRHKSAALECIRAIGSDSLLAEDVFFSNCIDVGLGKRPHNASLLSDFCSEMTFLSRSFGTHQPLWMAWSPQMLDRFLQYCPEAQPLAPEGKGLPGTVHVGQEVL